jgi:hypothetical protein
VAGWHVVNELRTPATPAVPGVGSGAGAGAGDEVRRRLVAALLQLPPAVAQLGEAFTAAG